MGQEFVVPSFNTNRYYNKNTDAIAVLPSGATAGSVMFIGSTGTLAQDNANFFWDDTNNRLGIGTTTPEAPLEIVTVGTTGLSYLATNYSTNGAGPYLRLRQSRGTEAAPTIVSSGDDLGYLQFQGYDGAAFRAAANITASVDGTPGSTDMPGRLIFSTTPDGSATLTERLRIDSLGRIQQQVGGATAQALTGSTFVVAKSQSGITTVGSGRYFSLQNTSGATNEVVEIGFGYIGAGVNQPVLIGHKTTSGSGATKGSLYMAVRDVTTDTAPTEVWTLDPTGQVTQNMPAAASTAETLHTWQVSDDATSKIQINNLSSTNGVFIPRVDWISSGTNQASFQIFQGTTDTGTTPLLDFYARIGAGTTVATRPLFRIQNNGTEKWSMAADGAITQTITSTASTAETLHTWKVSDDATARLEVRSGTTVDGAYIPQLRGFGSSALTGLQFVAQLTTDTGANTAMLFDARVGASTAVATRPLFQWTNNGTGVMILDNRGRFTLAPLAATSGTTAQFILTPGADTGLTASTESNVFRVDAATRTWADGTVALQRDFLFTAQTYNKTTTSATFTQAATVAITDTPRQGTGVTITTSIGLLIQNSAAATGTMPNGYALKAISPTGATISYAGWFQASAVSSAAETICRFDVSDDATGKLEILNNSVTDATFVPLLRGTSASTNIGLVVRGASTTDTGTTAVSFYDSRIGTATAVATRKAFLWANNGTEVMNILGTTAGSALSTLGGRIKFVRSVSSTTITVAATDHIVLSSTGGGAVAVSLPASPETGREYTIKDNAGDAATNNITVTPAAGNIDGAGTYVMSANYESATFVYNGTQWNVVSSHN